jgi:hypothetical protein
VTDPLIEACARALSELGMTGRWAETVAAHVLAIARPRILEEAAKCCEEYCERCQTIRADCCNQGDRALLYERQMGAQRRSESIRALAAKAEG